MSRAAAAKGKKRVQTSALGKPGPGSGRFARCVAGVAAKGGARDARAVCAAAGRKKYGAAKMARWAKQGRKLNPEAAAAELFERFHGEPATGYTEYEVQRHYHANAANLGRLILLDVELRDGTARRIKSRGVELGASEDGGQLLFYGGDQSLDLADYDLVDSLPKDFVRLGRVFQIAYHTSKQFHNFAPVDYYHFFGLGSDEKGPGDEDTWPELVYDVRSQLVFMVDGVYQVRPEGIVD